MNLIITLLRKPLEDTVSRNVLRYGTGGLNVDASRQETSEEDQKAMERCNSPGSGNMTGALRPLGTFHTSANKPVDVTKGRWPANVVLTTRAEEGLNDEVSRYFKTIPDHE